MASLCDLPVPVAHEPQNTQAARNRLAGDMSLRGDVHLAIADAPCEIEDVNEVMLRAIDPPDHSKLSIEGMRLNAFSSHASAYMLL